MKRTLLTTAILTLLLLAPGCMVAEAFVRWAAPTKAGGDGGADTIANFLPAPWNYLASGISGLAGVALAVKKSRDAAKKDAEKRTVEDDTNVIIDSVDAALKVLPPGVAAQVRDAMRGITSAYGKREVIDKRVHARRKPTG